MLSIFHFMKFHSNFQYCLPSAFFRFSLIFLFQCPFFFFFFASLCSLWDLNSLTTDQTWAHSGEGTAS